MADKDHFELLMRDVNAWNGWRAENPKEKPDLSFAVMRGADLMLANLSGALLSEADLVLANLRGADLRHADLRGANLVAARLMGADHSAVSQPPPSALRYTRLPSSRRSCPAVRPVSCSMRGQ